MKLAAGGAWILLLLVGAGLPAAEDGGQPLAFSKLAVGARPAALGGAAGALGGDAYGATYNPALLATLDDLRLGSQWASLPSGRTQQFLGFGRAFQSGDTSSYGLAYHRSALEGIEKRRGNTPEADGHFSESSSILSASLAGWLWPQHLALGASFKALQQNLGDASGSGYSGDFGFFWRALPWADFGVSFQDFASHWGWNTSTAENLPLLVRGSSALHFWDDRAIVSVDVEKSQAQESHYRAGTEFWAWPKVLALRLGWNQGQWSTGLGLHSTFFGWMNDAGLDYALVGDSLGSGELQHRFSLDFGFSLEPHAAE